ncbi:MarP family serine protease [Leucobacter weissii]|uniref:Serine protease n=1 Tax=Leucobacter weissii TaxID=1983706 RepID=A0A939MNI2_9MICO|nr:MarP family serine protease [Leucobacter weissii]MBO1902072.1 MarP family serine protease [Leucobacter weissii]
MDSAMAALIVDLVLVLWLVSQIVFGARYGVARTSLALGGLAIGGLLAWWTLPVVAEWTNAWGGPALLPILVGGALVLTTAGIGAALGIRLTAGLKRARLGALNRLLGAAAGLVISSLVLVLVAGGLSALGNPFVSQLVSSSRVVSLITGLLPDELRGRLQHLGRDTVTDGIPWLIEAIDGVDDPPALPRVDLDDPALAEAAESVVRVSGNSYACGQRQLGSGFVVAENRIITNAHVVAGADEVVVEVPGQRGRSGVVSYFDAESDLAVVSVEDLSARALPLGSPLDTGSEAVVQGYPGGGEFSSRAARVLDSRPVAFQDGGTREVITLAADVRQGNSGGPLLALNGEVAGVVFAKEERVENVGYAIPLSVLRPVAERAAELVDAVGTGVCAG